VSCGLSFLYIYIPAKLIQKTSPVTSECLGKQSTLKMGRRKGSCESHV